MPDALSGFTLPGVLLGLGTVEALTGAPAAIWRRLSWPGVVDVTPLGSGCVAALTKAPRAMSRGVAWPVVFVTFSVRAGICSTSEFVKRPLPVSDATWLVASGATACWLPAC